MVLVLLGILAAVAVPKYFDLQKQAQEKALAADAAEFQARLNAAFAKSLLDGNGCSDSRDAGWSEVSGAASDLHAVELKKPTTGGTHKVKFEKDKVSKEFEIAIPMCESDKNTGGSNEETGS